MTMKVLMTTVFVLGSLTNALDYVEGEGCSLIDCAKGFECDPLNSECVAISCDAENVCPKDEECFPEDRLCIRAPCPQFQCQPKTNICERVRCATGTECDRLNGQCVPVECSAEGACNEGDNCVPDDSVFCFREPCPRFRCVDPDICSRITCLVGNDCDNLLGACVPVTCEAPNACPSNQQCKPRDIQCIRSPCPQFSCVDKPKGCVTDCGEEISPFSFFKGDGEDYCKSCICFRNGKQFCFPFRCRPNKEKERCDTGCLTTCGETVATGETYNDDGSNFCNTCTCLQNGASSCTRKACNLDDPESRCPSERCLTTCGETVAVGETYIDDGANFCNTCTCLENGFSSCTRRGCNLDDPKARCPSDGCLTTCGEPVAVGEQYTDDGSNFCNQCTCEANGVSSCTEQGCDIEDPKAQCSSDGCLTTCGETVAVGETYTDDGSNFCNTCTCQENGISSCTKIGCNLDDPKARCPSDGCLTTCGEPVAVGEQYTDDGSNFCNQCTCQENGLSSCTKIGCNIQDSRAQCSSDGCLTTCGNPVAVGSFTDDGTNFCNSCSCQKGGPVICTLQACDPKSPQAECK